MQRLFGLADRRQSDRDRDGKDSAVCYTTCELFALECKCTRLVRHLLQHFIVITMLVISDTPEDKLELPDLGSKAA